LTQPRKTIRDVATDAGVSHQTVSRVINNSDQVSPVTRARVKSVIKELDYRPHAVARSLARGRSCTFVCISPNLVDLTFAGILEGAEAEARGSEYLLVSSSAPDDESFSTLIDQLIPTQRVDGMIIINPYVDARHMLVPEDFPVVYVGSHSTNTSISSVALDDFEAGRAAAQHLLDLGYRKISMVTGPPNEDCTQDRSAGYRLALQKAGLPFEEVNIRTGDWSATSGYGAYKSFLASGLRPTAVFTQNDLMAVGVMRAAQEENIRIPSELSVIGIDNIPLASYFDPKLTTMKQDLNAIGREATRLLIDTIGNPNNQREHVKISPQLVIRNSTTLHKGGDGQ
jgi:DNA-binding LacI/PurR family transcriptional regulator